MITVALLLILLGLSWFLLAGFQVGSLTALERVYLWLSPVPVLLAVGVSIAVTVLRLDSASTRVWSNRLSAAGVWLSVSMILAGLALMGRRHGRGHIREGRLAAGLFLAGIPALLTAIVVLLYRL